MEFTRILQRVSWFLRLGVGPKGGKYQRKQGHATERRSGLWMSAKHRPVTPFAAPLMRDKPLAQRGPSNGSATTFSPSTDLSALQ